MVMDENLTHWVSVHRKDGAHYNVYSLRNSVDGMEALRSFFPESKADSLNFVLFSTSGIHGTYATIEDFWRMWNDQTISDDEKIDGITFLIVQPRLVCLRYGTAAPGSLEDVEFLKRLRESSWSVAGQIGKAD